MKFDKFLERVMPILVSENCEFGYQRKNCKKHGHYKKRKNNISGEILYEIKIEKNDNDAAKIYTLVHEMTHMINHHLDRNEISSYQKEWVADDVGIKIIDFLKLKDELLSSNLSKKWDVLSYGSNFIKNRKNTLKKRVLMDEQSRFAYNLIIMHMKNGY